MKNSLTKSQDTSYSFKNILDTIQYAFHKQYITNEQKHLYIHMYEDMLINQIYYFNHKNSSSISETNYSRLEKAIYYIINHATPSPLCASLATHSLNELYTKGILRLKMDVAQLTQDIKQLQTHQLPFQNDRYHDVLFNQLPDYLQQLKSYDALYSYHHTNKDLDYPLIDGIPLFSHMYYKDGTDVVKEYVKRLQVEEFFCIKFQKDLPTFLEQYEKQKGINIMDININLFEILLHQCFANIILYQQENIFLCEQDITQLKRIATLPNLLQEAKRRIQDYISSLERALQQYIQKNEAIIYEEWRKFLYSDYHLFLYEQDESNFIQVTLPHTSDAFTIYLTNLNNSTSIEQKLSYIKNQHITLYDLLDLFEHNIFINNEYAFCFQTMGNMDLALLLKLQLPQLNAFHHNTSLDSLLQEFECESVWQQEWKKYIINLPSKTKEEIITISRNIIIS